MDDTILRLRQFAAIARATLLETMQQPVALLLTLTAVTLTTLTPVFQFHALGDEGRLARDSGLAYLLVFGLVLAATAASSALTRELASGTAAAALSTPVGRPLFLLAKFAGVVSVLLPFWGAVTAATLLAERASEHFIATDNDLGWQADNLTATLALLAPVAALAAAALLNRFHRVRFGLAAALGLPLSLLAVLAVCGIYNRFGRWTGYAPDLNVRVLPLAALVLLALVMFAALATALATRFGAAPTLVVCALALALGLAADTLTGTAPALSWRGLLGGLLPNLQHFWLCDALADNGRVPWHYVVATAAYAGTWCAGVLGVGALALRHRDVG